MLPAAAEGLSLLEIPAYAGMVHGGRGIIRGFGFGFGRQLGGDWRRRMTILAAYGGFYGGVAACGCEIPASAGMVYLGTGDLRTVLAAATIWRIAVGGRFPPTQEWAADNISQNRF